MSSDFFAPLGRTARRHRRFVPAILPLEDRTVPAVVAQFNPATKVLTIIGDAADNAITVSRDAAGNISAGSVPILSRVPVTVAGTAKIKITGGAGNDDIRGDAGTDTLNGGGGNDILDGGADADTLNGGDGADTITGGAANDIMTGGNGDDVFLVGVGAGIDNFDGGAGSDTIRATADNAVVPSDQKQRGDYTTPSWRSLGFSHEFSYYRMEIVTQPAGGQCRNPAGAIDLYQLRAVGDLDGDGITSLFEVAVGSTNENELYRSKGFYVNNETE